MPSHLSNAKKITLNLLSLAAKRDRICTDVRAALLFQRKSKSRLPSKSAAYDNELIVHYPAAHYSRIESSAFAFDQVNGKDRLRG